MNIDKLVEQFRNFDELKVFCNSQFQQIAQLSKKNKDLEDSNIALKKQIKSNNSKEMAIDFNKASSIILSPQGRGPEDACIIAQVQLKLLKDLSFERELSLEESKRVELFNRILTDPTKEKDKPLKADITVLNQADLLKLVE